LTSGTWTCIVTDANSCTATRTFTITQPTAIDTSVSLTSGVLTATQTGATYQWYECPNTIQIGATSQSFTPTAIGNYRVSINISGCSDTSSCVSVTTLQIGEFEFKNSFKIYPNPVQNILFVDFEDLENVAISISDTNGRTLINQKLNTTSNSINIENLSKGMYLIKLTSDQGNETIKVLKNYVVYIF
jgi:hypothetical protein